MRADYDFFRSVDDYRGYIEEYGDVRQWRIDLREKLYYARGRRSDLTQVPLIGGFAMHEGIFERRWVPKDHWQHILFAGPNVFLIPDSEHIPDPPDRTTCYWLSVARYGKTKVDHWIESLQFKVPPSTPWKGTNGIDVLLDIPRLHRVDKQWDSWFSDIKMKVNFEA